MYCDVIYCTTCTRTCFVSIAFTNNQYMISLIQENQNFNINVRGRIMYSLMAKKLKMMKTCTSQYSVVEGRTNFFDGENLPLNFSDTFYIPQNNTVEVSI